MVNKLLHVMILILFYGISSPMDQKSSDAGPSCESGGQKLAVLPIKGSGSVEVQTGPKSDDIESEFEFDSFVGGEGDQEPVDCVCKKEEVASSSRLGASKSESIGGAVWGVVSRASQAAVSGGVAFVKKRAEEQDPSVVLDDESEIRKQEAEDKMRQVLLDEEQKKEQERGGVLAGTKQFVFDKLYGIGKNVIAEINDGRFDPIKDKMRLFEAVKELTSDRGEVPCNTVLLLQLLVLCEQKKIPLNLSSSYHAFMYLKRAHAATIAQTVQLFEGSMQRANTILRFQRDLLATGINVLQEDRDIPDQYIGDSFADLIQDQLEQTQRAKQEKRGMYDC